MVSYAYCKQKWLPLTHNFLIDVISAVTVIIRRSLTGTNWFLHQFYKLNSIELY